MRALRAHAGGGGYRIVLTHGNGPVVGNILFRMAKTALELPPMPMDVCVAHSQGGMGYMLQQTLENVLCRHRIDAEVAAIITGVEVDADDPAFSNPTKPVGRFSSKDEAELMHAKFGWTFIEDSGRGYRRVVPSPDPKPCAMAAIRLTAPSTAKSSGWAAPLAPCTRARSR